MKVKLGKVVTAKCRKIANDNDTAPISVCWMAWQR